MADFCRACSIEMFGKDFRELANITLPESWADGRAAANICEGCGIIQLDPDGNCVSRDCTKAGEVGHGLPWAGQPGFPGNPRRSRRRKSACRPPIPPCQPVNTLIPFWET